MSKPMNGDKMESNKATIYWKVAESQSKRRTNLNRREEINTSNEH